LSLGTKLPKSTFFQLGEVPNMNGMGPGVLGFFHKIFTHCAQDPGSGSQGEMTFKYRAQLESLESEDKVV
jgi:hypothetical protein